VANLFFMTIKPKGDIDYFYLFKQEMKTGMGVIARFWH